MPFSNVWPTQENTTDPRDKLSRDELLTLHIRIKDQLDKLKQDELELRKYIVKRAFPEAKEGMNTQELGNGYQLKAGVKFNYKLNSDNKIVEGVLDEIASMGNEGGFIADRLVSWTPNFLLTEYRQIQKDAEDGSEQAKKMLFIISKMLTIEEAAPTLEIKEPKGKK